SALDTAELLAILLGKGKRGESALELSNRLLQQYNLHGLEVLGYKELKRVCRDDGIKALQLLSFVELSKRYNKLINGGYKQKITSAEDVFNRFKDRLGQEKQEHFIVLYLDSKHQILKEETISIGTLDASLVHPREVFKRAIQESAYGIILVHNHPSGDPEPSEEDKEITRRLFDVGEVVAIKVLDHIIIGKESHFSFKEV
ncbi:MAG TPA: DNA repair protein RadC, partial [Candidatus Nanoarchaeia archaeon]|nr:DNA repair protein RadC [Candidatus Nanoarchaeia archaeon]